MSLPRAIISRIELVRDRASTTSVAFDRILNAGLPEGSPLDLGCLAAWCGEPPAMNPCMTIDWWIFDGAGACGFVERRVDIHSRSAIMNTHEDMEIAVAIFESEEHAHLAHRELQRMQFDMTRVSLVGRECRAAGHVIGFLSVGDRALSEALTAIGIPRESLACYEMALQAGRSMLLVHGDGNDARIGHAVLVGFKPVSMYHHVAAPTATLASRA